MKPASLRRVLARLRALPLKVMGRAAEILHPTNKSGNNASVR